MQKHSDPSDQNLIELDKFFKIVRDEGVRWTDKEIETIKNAFIAQSDRKVDKLNIGHIFNINFLQHFTITTVCKLTWFYKREIIWLL